MGVMGQGEATLMEGSGSQTGAPAGAITRTFQSILEMTAHFGTRTSTTPQPVNSDTERE